jgi:hypothetical protein
MLLKTVFEFRHKNFTNTPDRPLSTGLNGNDKLVSFSATKPVAENAALNLEFDYLNQSTALNFYTNSTYAVIGAYRMHYNAPFKLMPYPWETSLFLGRAWSIYAAPDPCCNTNSDPDLFFSTSHPSHTSVSPYCDRAAIGTRYRLIELADLRIYQQFGLARPANPLLALWIPQLMKGFAGRVDRRGHGRPDTGAGGLLGSTAEGPRQHPNADSDH